MFIKINNKKYKLSNRQVLEKKIFDIIFKNVESDYYNTGVDINALEQLAQIGLSSMTESELKSYANKL